MSRKRVDAGEQARLARERLAAAGLHGQAPGAVGPRKGNGAAGPPQVAAPDPGLGPAESLRLGALGWLDRPPPPVEWLLQDVLALGEVGFVAAPGATAKTWLLLQLAIGIASGTSVADFGIAGPLWRVMRPAPVLLLTSEERAADLHRRVWAIVNSLSLSEQCRAWLLANFYIRSMRGIDSVVSTREPGSLRWKDSETGGKIKQLAESIKGVELVVLEPVSRLRAGDENDAAATSAMISFLESLSESTGATVLTASHVSKWSKGESELSQDGVRGSSALVDNARWVAIMRRMTAEEAQKMGVDPASRRANIQLAIPKANNSAGHENRWLEQMSNGVLRLVNLNTPDRPTGRGTPEDEYLRVVSDVSQFLLSHPGEQWTVGGLERAHAGASGVFRCGQKMLRAILGRAIEEGRLIAAEGRGLGYLSVPARDG